MSQSSIYEENSNIWAKNYFMIWNLFYDPKSIFWAKIHFISQNSEPISIFYNMILGILSTLKESFISAVTLMKKMKQTPNPEAETRFHALL